MTWKKINGFFARARNVLSRINACVTRNGMPSIIALEAIPLYESVRHKSVSFKTKTKLIRIVKNIKTTTNYEKDN